MLTGECECEHAAHFADDHEHGPSCFGDYGLPVCGHDVPVKTPNGNPGHVYGHHFALAFLKSVTTSCGTFRICLDCAGDCYAEEGARCWATGAAR